MSFKLHIAPAASDVLQTISPHVVAQLGRALADFAESMPATQGPIALASGRIELGAYAALYDVDRSSSTLRITDVEQLVDVSMVASAITA